MGQTATKSRVTLVDPKKEDVIITMANGARYSYEEALKIHVPDEIHQKMLDIVNRIEN
ncbi:hypothetical protein AB6831_04060 [Carnobacterium divergens]|uniref:hypothetical protein n=1 Tax=Carnobacterium divergens TaxID=2748 RepID=UPI0039C920BC